MAAQLIDGKEVAKRIRDGLTSRIATLKDRGITPGLAAVLVGNDPASETYVNSKAKACEKLGLYSEVIRRDASISQAELEQIIARLNTDDKVHGILVQSPLPPHMDELAVTIKIAPQKDVDGFHPYNVGMMLLGRGGLLPCTPHGVIKLLEHYSIETDGREVVVIGRSNIVGKPVAALLVQKAKYANATVTIAHSRSQNLAEITRRADILIAAIGRPSTVTADMVKPGAVIIDVGVNRIEDRSVEKGYRLVGDVDFEKCAPIASYITPVPGGVGPMTIAMLMANTVLAAEQINSPSTT